MAKDFRLSVPSTISPCAGTQLAGERNAGWFTFVTPGADLPTILACARELYGRAVYSHKTHEVERELWADVVFRMNVGNVCLAAATTIAAVIAASIKPTWVVIVTAVLAAASICFVIWQASFDPAGKEGQHRAAAKELFWIREQFLLMIAHCSASNANVSDLQRSMDMLTLQITAAYKFTPSTSPKAYKLADERLKRGEFTFSDEEIDAFLPLALRKNQTALQP
ncbi:MAG: SLATT domain-containing protein [Acidobacteriota bacterium]|nr:SLATT domain-containing protein [Acidobacteriota bacterium]